MRQSQQQESQALATAEQQRQRAQREAVVARQQTLLARAQTALASLRVQVAQALNLLPTAEAAPGLVPALDVWSRSQSIPAAWAVSASTLQQAWLSSQETNLLLGHRERVTAVAYSPDARLIASGSGDRMVRRWVASPQDWFRLACTRMAHHPLLVNPSSVTTDQELVAAGKRAHQACQLANRSAERAQHQSKRQGLAGLLAWARRLLP